MKEEKTTIAEQLRAGRPVAAFTRGVSMQPLLYENKTHVLIEPLRRELTVGELPIFLRPDGKYVIHRVVGVEENYYYTRGDNCIAMEKVPKERMLGVVTEIYRNKKYIKVTDPGYRFYVAVWQATAPVRIFWFRRRAGMRRLLCKMKNKLCQKTDGIHKKHEK